MFADLIVRAGRVRTLNPRRPRASAFAVRDGAIIAVGDRGSVDEFRGDRTEVLDLGTAVVTPGLIDAHTHPILGVKRAVGRDLAAAKDGRTLLAMLADEATRTPSREWVRAWNASYDAFDTISMTADAIEEAVGGRPALVLLFDGHTALASRAALTAASITGSRSFDDTSVIVVDHRGLPTGELREESAIAAVLQEAPSVPEDRIVEAVAGVFRQMAAAGITGGVFMDGDARSFDLLDRLEGVESGLPLRVVVALQHDPGYGEERLQQHLSMVSRRGERWRGGLIKLYADGVIDTGTGWLHQPDRHGEGTFGLWERPEDFAAVVRRYSRAGFRIATHAIGDRAVSAAIDAYLASGAPAGRHRVEHLELITDRDIGRMASAGITASLQPSHMQWRAGDGSDSWAERVGSERATYGWRLGDLARAGVRVALGSDWPVAQLDPRIGMAWARLRRVPGDPSAPVFEPEQVLSPYEALIGFTAGAADAQGDPGLGRLAVGCRADFTVWDEDPLEASADDLVTVPIAATYVDGVATFRAEA